MKLFPAKCRERATLRKLMSNGKQFTITCTHEMLTTVAGDQRWRDVVAGISAHFSKFALICFVLLHVYNKLPSARETLRFSGNKIHCSPRDQSLSVK